MMSLIRRILKIPQTSERKKKEADAKKKRTSWWLLVGWGSGDVRQAKTYPTTRGTQPVFYNN